MNNEKIIKQNKMRNEEQIKSKIIETLYSAGCDEAGAYLVF